MAAHATQVDHDDDHSNKDLQGVTGTKQSRDSRDHKRGNDRKAQTDG